MPYFVRATTFIQRQSEKTLEECGQLILVMKQAPSDLIILLHDEKSALGILNLRSLPQDPMKHSLDFGVAVRAHWRGKGVASLLMREVFEFAKKNPTIRRIQMSVVSENKPAIEMYSKLGFQVEGRRKLAVQSGDGKFYDEVLMAKFINQ